MTTVLFYNGDWHKQKPLTFIECMGKPVSELFEIFHKGNYRRNTGTFLMTDCLAKNIDAEYVSAFDFDRINELKPDTIVTNALHCVSPRFFFDKEYWQKLLDTGAKIVPMTFGFRYHENGDFYLTDDMIYIFKAISERNEIGVRGEIVAEILNKYGIKNVRIVGCHSLFYHNDKNFKVDSKKEKVQSINFCFNQCFSDFFQSHVDFCRLSLPIFNYFFSLYKKGSVNVDYTLQIAFMKEYSSYSNFTRFEWIQDFVVQKGRYFFSVDDWITALKKNDFSIGTQFHGNLAAILAKTPALIITIDKRMEELAKYHHIPFIKAEEFDVSKPIDYYFDLCDYSEFNKYYEKTYNEFVDYCYRNGVQLKSQTVEVHDV